MSREHAAEYDRLCGEARAWLRARSECTIMLLGHCPSFADNRFVCVDSDGDSGCVIEFRRWFTGVDAEKVRNPIERLRWPKALVPTTVSLCQTVSRNDVDIVINKFNRISIPANGFGVTLLDGTWVEVQTKEREMRFPLGCGDQTTPGRRALAELEAWFVSSWTMICAPVNQLKEWIA